MLKNNIYKCKTKTKVNVESCGSEYESCASDYESCVSEYESCVSEYESYATKPFDSEPIDSVNNTKTWVSMLSDSDNEYDSYDSGSEETSDSDSDSEYDSCDADDDSQSEETS